MVRTGEKLITMAEARQIVAEKTGRRVSLPTLWRWAMHGIKGVKLAHARVGREIRTTAEALERFYLTLAAAYSEAPLCIADHDDAHAQAERARRAAA